MTAVSLNSVERTALARREPVDGMLSWPVYDDARQVASEWRPELPVLCFSPNQLRINARKFVDGFPGEVAYAVKANSAGDVIKTIGEAGINVFDVASTQEMAVVASACFDAELHYHNPVKSRTEIATAYETFGCRRFAADCTAEIKKIFEVTGSSQSIDIAIRFRLPAHGQSVHDFSTKFGATANEAVTLMQYADQLGFGCVLTFHPGSQCGDPEAWQRHVAAAAQIARDAGVRLKVLNVGGGFPAQYSGPQIPGLIAFFTRIADSVAKEFADMAIPALECEPGRGIAATSQSVLTRVKLVKPERCEVFLNDGIYGALMEVSQVPELQPPHRAIRTKGDFCKQVNDWIVYGPTCDPLDVLPMKLPLPSDIAEDDFIEFGTVGAYGTATATGFNGYGQFDHACVEYVVAA